MQPAVIQQLAELPRLATGKPDRRRLPQIALSARRDEAPYVPPQLLAEQQLIQIWEELLEPGPIGIKDNFFHLGGNSLQAAQLLDRIERTSGKKVALSALFANPTVEQLAQTLQNATQESGERVRLQTVQAEGSKTPFFFLHGDWTGGAFYCFALARACGPDQPFYVLEPYRFSAQEQVPTLETIAAAHIEAMRRVRPQGPYQLGGFCNGGLLAYEMARQLERGGEQVDFLGLIDPSPPVQSSLLRMVCDAAQKARRAGSERQADLYLRARHTQRHIYRRLLPRGGRVQDFGRLVAIDPRLDAMFAPRDALYADYIGVLTWAAARYRTGIYRGRITFFWAREEKGIARTWRPVNKHIQAADLDERTIAGSHMATITDHIQDLAVKLSACLAQAGQDADRAPRRREPDGDAVPCKIRPMCGRDVWQVLAIERQAFPDDPWTALTVNGWLARATRAGRARHATRIARFIRFIRLNETVNLVKLIRLLLLDQPTGLRYVVAEAADGEIVGYACLSAHGTEATIPMIAVRPDSQRRRIGTDLLMELIAMAAAGGCHDISLFVRADNSRARRLYGRTGFTEAGIQPGFYQPSGTDAVVVRLSIPNPGENPP